MFNRTAGTQFKVIAGYKGTSDIDIALERGEVDGVGAELGRGHHRSRPEIRQWRHRSGFRGGGRPHEADPERAEITEFGRNDDEKTFLGIYTSSGTIGRALAFPPGVPADRVAALREAYAKTIRDPEFLAEVKGKNILFDPMSGPDLQAYVDKYMKTPAERVRRGEEDLLRIAGDALNGPQTAGGWRTPY